MQVAFRHSSSSLLRSVHSMLAHLPFDSLSLDDSFHSDLVRSFAVSADASLQPDSFPMPVIAADGSYYPLFAADSKRLDLCLAFPVRSFSLFLDANTAFLFDHASGSARRIPLYFFYDMNSDKIRLVGSPRFNTLFGLPALVASRSSCPESSAHTPGGRLSTDGRLSACGAVFCVESFDGEKGCVRAESLLDALVRHIAKMLRAELGRAHFRLQIVVGGGEEQMARMLADAAHRAGLVFVCAVALRLCIVACLGCVVGDSEYVAVNFLGSLFSSHDVYRRERGELRLVHSHVNSRSGADVIACRLRDRLVRPTLLLPVWSEEAVLVECRECVKTWSGGIVAVGGEERLVTVGMLAECGLGVYAQFTQDVLTGLDSVPDEATCVVLIEGIGVINTVNMQLQTMSIGRDITWGRSPFTLQ